MELSEKDIQVIDKYILGHLSQEEQSYFDERLSTDSFAEELRLKQDLKIVYKSMDFDKGKEKLRDTEAKLNENQSFFKKNRTWIIVGMLLIISFLMLYLLNYKVKDVDSFYASYYSPYPNVISPLQRDPRNDKDIFQLYEVGEYEDALTKLEEKDDLNEDQYFYKGLSLLASEKYMQGKSIFEEVIKQESKYANAAEWYLALTYLKLDDVDSSLKYLQEIENQEMHPYKRNAANLLREMR